MATYEGAIPAKPVKEVPAGHLPAWKVVDLPAPPPYNFKNVIAIIGPGTILLGVSIGSGEWLMGPAVATTYGPTLLWIVTVSVLLQLALNMEMLRYTVATGEPIWTGYMRTSPGPTFWGWLYTVMGALQIALPGWAATSATATAAFMLGRLPGPEDAGLVLTYGYITFALVLVILAVGRKIERTLEIIETIMVVAIFSYLLFVDIFLVSFDTWAKVLPGFVAFGAMPPGADWLLLGGFAAYSGAGGCINGFLTNWYRDKGFGMGSTVGYISGMVGGVKATLRPTGNIFEPNEKNLANLREWYRYIRWDQYAIWAGGAIIGMGLTITLTVHFVPFGTKLSGLAIAAYQAEGMARMAGQIFWPLTLMMSAWLLFKTQLGNSEGYVRMITDIAWTGSERVRNWSGGDVRRIYYAILVVFALWGAVALQMTAPFMLVVLGANMAGVMFVFMGIHTVIVNRKFLPREIQAPLWREVLVIISSFFFLFFVVVILLNRFFGMTF
ncbi:MAG: Nramp family divalent metal transporter [Sphingomonadaceae bacterium]